MLSQGGNALNRGTIPANMRRLPWTLFLCCLPSVADTYPRRRGVDALDYTFRLTLSFTQDQVHAFELGGQQQEFVFPAEKEPSAVSLGPDSWALIRVGKFGR
jgi:hypothetical protein